ncbi:hypothetical protein M1563_04275, partial [Patescibacteria group bacterium]|nr:hypothetical protein [Patescibacteria group bacterium]
AIKTALANARQVNLDTEQLSFKTLEVNQGFAMKRMRPAGRGNRRLYKKRTSHIKVVLTDEIVKRNSKLRVQDNKTKTGINSDRPDIKMEPEIRIETQNSETSQPNVDKKITTKSEGGKSKLVSRKTTKTVQSRTNKSK